MLQYILKLFKKRNMHLIPDSDKTFHLMVVQNSAQTYYQFREGDTEGDAVSVLAEYYQSRQDKEDGNILEEPLIGGMGINVGLTYRVEPYPDNDGFL